MNDKLTIHTIHNRLRARNQSMNEGYNSLDIDHLAQSNSRDIMRSIEIVCKKSNPVQFESVLNLFDRLYESDCSIGQLNKICRLICEEAVPKVRSAKKTNTNLRRKLGNIKSKITTKIDNNVQDALSSVKRTINTGKKNLQTNTNTIKSNVKNGLGMKPKDESYIDCYETISSHLTMIERADCIIENYNEFSKRFNLERIFVDNTRINGVKDTVNEIAKFADTYDNTIADLFLITTESCWLGFENNGIKYTKTDILESALDYFCMDPRGYRNCIKALEQSVVFDPEDLPEDMEIITEEEPEDNSFAEMYANITGQLSNTDAHIALCEGYDFNKIFSDFKKSNDEHKETKLEFLVRKLYTKNVSNIVDDTPNFLTWIRRVFVLGTFALNPILGAIAVIGDLFAQLHMERKETEKMIKCFDHEIKEANTKLKSTKSEEEKKRLNAYIKSLKDTKKKIENYYDKMLTDKELDEKDFGSEDKDSFDDIKADIKGEEDDDFDFDDWDDFEEAAALGTLKLIDDLQDHIASTKDDIESTTLNSIDLFNADDIDSLSKLSVEYPDVWGPELLEFAIENRLKNIRSGKVRFENTLVRYDMINACESAIKRLKSYNEAECVDKQSIRDGLYSIIRLNEAFDAINAIVYAHKNRDIMIEASFTNSLKMASEKLKKTITKLSDKDKTISRNIDVSLSQLKKSAENAISNENREAVIKGSVIPQASKIIKLAITGGALWLVNPALSVISVLGYLGVSAHHKKKERQLILDELEIELKMCEKYIDIAESKNDMKSLKQLLTIQKNLTRQHQRIRYKMKVDFGENPTTTKGYQVND